jgi:hypothetical protein
MTVVVKNIFIITATVCTHSPQEHVVIHNTHYHPTKIKEPIYEFIYGSANSSEWVRPYLERRADGSQAFSGGPTDGVFE